MEIRYNRTGKERKELVNAIAEITGAQAIYKGVPTCNYEVDYYTINKKGTLTFDDAADSSEVEYLLEQLLERGFEAEVAECEEAFKEATEAPETGDTLGLRITVPFDKMGLGNLTNLLESKGELIKRALGIDDIRIEMNEDSITFPWFRKANPEDMMTYTKFIAALCKMSKEQKRISSKQKDIVNEKYEFRCFLLRLGFIGDDSKADRKILMRNLSGSAAFKSGSKGGEEA